LPLYSLSCLEEVFSQKRVDRVETLQQDKDALLASLEETVPKMLGKLTAEERRPTSTRCSSCALPQA
jgi:hypothetical protein